jgi:hypothetical protein
MQLLLITGFLKYNLFSFHTFDPLVHSQSSLDTVWLAFMSVFSLLTNFLVIVDQTSSLISNQLRFKPDLDQERSQNCHAL